MDSPYVVPMSVEGGRVRAIEQFAASPAAAAFWPDQVPWNEGARP
jgi:hypothetical protein